MKITKDQAIFVAKFITEALDSYYPHLHDSAVVEVDEDMVFNAFDSWESQQVPVRYACVSQEDPNVSFTVRATSLENAAFAALSELEYGLCYRDDYIDEGLEEREEAQRRNEKNGLYPQHEDPAN